MGNKPVPIELSDDERRIITAMGDVFVNMVPGDPHDFRGGKYCAYCGGRRRTGLFRRIDNYGKYCPARMKYQPDMRRQQSLAGGGEAFTSPTWQTDWPPRTIPGERR